jgi:pimeloyl-ACP methyl ester carboxylesterase
LRPRSAVLTLSVVLALTGGCSGSASPPAATASPTQVRLVNGGCLPGNATLVALRSGTSVVNAALLGDGLVGVVIAYESGGKVCTWLPLAAQLLARGYRVALFDYSGADAGADTAAVTAELRRNGVTSVFLIGGSQGGTEVLHGGVQITPPVSGVVNISGGLPDGVSQARRLKVPLLLVSARDDGILALHDEPAPRWMNQLYRAATSTSDRHVVLVDGTEHASSLFTGPQFAQVETAVLDFLHRHGGP